jgi:hypothetical protein
MALSRTRALHTSAALAVLFATFVGACSSNDDATPNGAASSSSGGTSSGSSGTSSGGTSGGSTTPPTNPDDGPAFGNPNGKCAVPAEAQPEDVSSPRTVVGSGTPESCTGDAFVAAVAKGGVITFNCGAAPATIKLGKTAKIVNNTGPKIVIDGGNKVTLSGDGKVRLLYMNTCDKAQVYTSGNCNDQTDPQLTLQNLTFVDGNAKGLAGSANGADEGGGGAVYVRSGRVKILHSRFFNNVCDDRASDIGGGAVRVLNHLEDGKGSTSRPVYIVDSTFGGKEGFGNTCANGGAVSSIGTSYTIINSVLTHSKAIGEGANDGAGGNGGAIYNDGNLFRLDLCGVLIENNHANEGGSAIFFVSNDHTGFLDIKDSILRKNPKGTFETGGFPGIYILAKENKPTVTNSTIER